jgi:hypothetical protein
MNRGEGGIRAEANAPPGAEDVTGRRGTKSFIVGPLGTLRHARLILPARKSVEISYLAVNGFLRAMRYSAKSVTPLNLVEPWVGQELTVAVDVAVSCCISTTDGWRREWDRTHMTPLDSVTYRFHNATVAVDASYAVADCPPLPAAEPWAD